MGCDDRLRNYIDCVKLYYNYSKFFPDFSVFPDQSDSLTVPSVPWTVGTLLVYCSQTVNVLCGLFSTRQLLSVTIFIMCVSMLQLADCFTLYHASRKCLYCMHMYNRYLLTVILVIYVIYIYDTCIYHIHVSLAAGGEHVHCLPRSVAGKVQVFNVCVLTAIVLMIEKMLGFLADRTNGRAYATVLRLSSVVVCPSSAKPLEIEAWFQRTTNRKWHVGYQMVTWPMASRDLERSNSWPQFA